MSTAEQEIEKEEIPYENQWGLTIKQEAFAQAVLVEKTLSDAYRKTYNCENMKDKSIHENACKLSKNTKVAPRIKYLRDQLSARNEVTLDRWYQEQARLAFADTGELFNEDGTLKPINEISKEARTMISGIDIETRRERTGEYDENGKPETELVTVTKIRTHSKNQALDQTGRALGAYEKDNLQKTDIIPILVDGIDWDHEEAEEENK